MLKFTNYLLNRRHAQQLKNAMAILSVIKTLTDNQYHIPVAVTLASSVSVSEKNPLVQVSGNPRSAGSVREIYLNLFVLDGRLRCLRNELVKIS